jgi:dolichol-phosphate mannosyltransferase
MLSLWRQGHKFVIGERVERREGWWHRQISSIYWRLLRRYAFSHYPELGYDFCLIDRQLANDINRINEKNASIFVLIFWLGYQPARVPIVREMRRDGSSQWKLGRKLVFTVDTMIGFTTFPARLLTLMGFGIASLAGLYFLHVLARYLILQSAPPGWMTLVALITLLGSLNLFAAGILSEYLLRILDESRKRPPFVVERTAGRESAFPS